MLYMQVEMALNYKTIRYVKEKDFPVELLRLAPNLRLFVEFFSSDISYLNELIILSSIVEACVVCFFFFKYSST